MLSLEHTPAPGQKAIASVLHLYFSVHLKRTSECDGNRLTLNVCRVCGRVLTKVVAPAFNAKITDMNKLHVFMLCLMVVFFACEEDCNVGRSAYTFETTIEGELRVAKIMKPVNECIRAPILFFFHGRGGTAQNSAAYYKFHNVELLDHMYIVYAQGTNYDDHPEDANGWVIRFPHIKSHCSGKDKDLQYLQAIIDHLSEDENADVENMGAAGFSNGGFFTLSLAALWPHTFKGFACLGCYSSYSPTFSLIDCEDSYKNAIDKGAATAMNALIKINPAPTLYMFGNSDSTLVPGVVSAVYKENCNEFCYFQNTILQLIIKNNSLMSEPCSVHNFMTDTKRQIFKAKSGGAETQVQLYIGDHSWPVQATTWMAEYFAELLYH